MTAGQIERHLYETIKALNPPVSGEVYYRGMRPEQTPPLGTGKEDIVVAVITGDNGHLQKGSCVVNAYVPDILVSSGAYLRDKARTDEIEAWLDTLPDQLSKSEIIFTKSSIILTLPEEQLRQHFVSLKLDFTTLNENY